MNLDAFAQQAQSRFKACGMIRFWGAHAAHPADDTFEVTKIEVRDGALVIHLHTINQESQIVVDGPSGCTVSEQELDIRDAARIRWLNIDRLRPASTTKPALELA